MKRLLLLLLLVGFGYLNAQNTLPVITASAKQNVSFGEQACIEITTTDADGDSVFIGWDKSIYANFGSNNHQVKFAAGQVCITASRSKHLIGSNPFMVFATDGKDTVFKACDFIVHDSPYKVHPVIKRPYGNTFFVDVLGDDIEPWDNYEDLSYQSYISDLSNNILYGDTSRKFTFTATVMGKYLLVTTYKTYGALYTSIDTLNANAPLSAKTPNAEQLHLYPNPAVSYISVDGLQGLPATVEVVDVTGKTLLTTRFNAQTQAIDVSGLPTGVYVVAVKGDGNNFFAVSKFVKQ
jgi:hypothetical protein